MNSNKNKYSTDVAHRRKSDGAVQTVSEHLWAVARLAGLFAGKIGLQKVGELIGLLHDVGKWRDKFQGYINGKDGVANQDCLKGGREKVDHSTAGAQWAWKELSSRGPMESISAQIVALCVASHHGGLMDCLRLRPAGPCEDVFSRRLHKKDLDTGYQEVRGQADVNICTRIATLLNGREISDGLQDFHKKIISCFPEKESFLFAQGLLVRYLFSCLVDADRIDSADFDYAARSTLRLHGRYTSWEVLVERLERKLTSFPSTEKIDDKRREISLACKESARRKPGIYTLTVPTGGGKTLAGLRFALHHARDQAMDRVINVIPYTSIIEQNAGVVREILEPEGVVPGSVVLEHHSNLTAEQESWQGKLLAENWDAPVVYTTLVQLLETLFGGGTRPVRRMHQLARAVIVFDEIQTLPIRCIHLFNNAINFLVYQCGATVVLCTATQPLLHKLENKAWAIRLADDHELVSGVISHFEALKRVEVRYRRKPGGWPFKEVVDLALVEVERAGNCLIIVNTKSSAKKLFDSFHESGKYPVIHLSTGMCPAHRRQRLNTVKTLLNDGRRFVCISTQLIEAGVDIDFRAVIRFLAGLDAIAQAAGRCNRHGKEKLGRVHVINPRGENLGTLEDIRRGGEDAERILSEFAHDPIGPEALTRYYHYYFFNRQKEMDYSVPESRSTVATSLVSLLSDNEKAVKDFYRESQDKPIPLHHAFRTAGDLFSVIDAPTEGVIVPYGDEGKKIIEELIHTNEPAKERELLRQAQPYSINIYPEQMKEPFIHPIKPGSIIRCLDAEHYSQEYGFSNDPVVRMEG